MTQFKSVIARLTLLSVVLTFTAAAQAASDDLDREFDVGAGGTLSIESDAGAIEVTTWDQNRVQVQVRNSGGFDVEFEQRGDSVEVRADSRRGGLFGIGRSRIGFRVNVPVNYNLDLDTGGGQIEVSDITGDVDADTSGGSIQIGVVSNGDVNADTSGGRITIEAVDGNIVADTSGGNITIGDVTGSVEADTSGGRINIGNVQGYMLADTSGGNIEVGEGGARVELSTSGGSIRAAWAIGSISADTSGGNIHLAGSDTSVDADTSGGSIVIDASNGPVRADTSGGNITVNGARDGVYADTAGGRIEVELVDDGGEVGGEVNLDTAGGDITLRIPGNLQATISADLEVSRRSRGDYRIYTDFPLSIRDDDGDIIGRGELNGGGDRIRLSTTNSDIHILNSDN